MKIYIIHSPSTSENYIENVRLLERIIINGKDCVVNQLPDQVKDMGDKELYDMYKDKIKESNTVIAMKEWDKSVTGNPEMAEALKHSINIVFEKQLDKLGREMLGGKHNG